MQIVDPLKIDEIVDLPRKKVTDEKVIEKEHNEGKRSEPKSLYEVLWSCSEGKKLLLRYEEKGLLDKVGRRRLCDVIVDVELRSDPNKRITIKRLSQLAHDVTKVFKKESPSAYFSPFAKLSPQKYISAKGKLLDCYRQRRAYLIKSGVIGNEKRCVVPLSGSESQHPSTSVRAAVMQLQDQDETDIKKGLQWLKKNSKPWKIVEQNWAVTTKTRLNLLQSKKLNIQQYYSEFKALNQPEGIFLLLKDYNMLYPEIGKKLKQNWLSIRPKIVELAKKRSDTFLKAILEDIEHEPNEEVINLAVFMAIPFVMTTLSVTKLRSKRDWCPSKQEVLEGFITRVDNAAEIEKTISQRAKKLDGLGLSLQPIIIVVGPSIKSISARYIIVNNIRYEVTSIMDAVDACFKIMAVLNAPYPAECVYVWQFIQIALYALKYESDTIYTITKTLLTDLKIPQVI